MKTKKDAQKVKKKFTVELRSETGYNATATSVGSRRFNADGIIEMK